MQLPTTLVTMAASLISLIAAFPIVPRTGDAVSSFPLSRLTLTLPLT
jgi:hypothetical protein